MRVVERYFVEKNLYLICTAFTIAFQSNLYAQWEPDRRLTDDTSSSWTSSNNARCVAASGDTVHVVWSDYRDRGWRIYYKRSTDGGISWGADVRLSNDSSYYSSCPSTTVCQSHVHVVWHDARDGNEEIYYKHSSNGGTTWSYDIRLTNAPNHSEYPSVDLANSDIHLVWMDNRSGNYGIYYKRSTDGGLSWSPDTCITIGPVYSADPAVAVAGPHVHVAWRDLRDGNNEIYYKRSTDGGANWGTDIRLTNDTAFSWNPSITSTDNSIHIAWVDERDVFEKVYYKRSTDNGVTWSQDIKLTETAASVNGPSITVLSSRVHVVWGDYQHGYPEIYYKRSTDNGLTWEQDTRLTNKSAYSDRPSITVSNPRLHVVWSDNRDGNYEIYYKRNPTGNIVDIGNSSVLNASNPEVGLQSTPNPFTDFAIIHGHKHEWFILYDISGSVCGIYKGEKIGDGLVAGVYFLKALSGNGQPLRVVKVR